MFQKRKLAEEGLRLPGEKKNDFMAESIPQGRDRVQVHVRKDGGPGGVLGLQVCTELVPGSWDGVGVINAPASSRRTQAKGQTPQDIRVPPFLGSHPRTNPGHCQCPETPSRSGVTPAVPVIVRVQ